MNSETIDVRGRGLVLETGSDHGSASIRSTNNTHPLLPNVDDADLARLAGKGDVDAGMTLAARADALLDRFNAKATPAPLTPEREQAIKEVAEKMTDKELEERARTKDTVGQMAEALALERAVKKRRGSTAGPLALAAATPVQHNSGKVQTWSAADIRALFAKA